MDFEPLDVSGPRTTTNRRTVRQILLAKENSYLVQVYANTKTIWKGEPSKWPSFTVSIKLAKALRRSSCLHSSDIGIVIECCKTRRLYHVSTSDHLDIKIESDGTRKGWFKRDIRGHSKIHVKVHTDMFQSGDTFRVIVAAMKRDTKPLNSIKDLLSNIDIFGASQIISVTSYALHIQQHFKSGKIVNVPDIQNAVIFYKDMAPRNEKLKVAITLLDERGVSCAQHLPHLPLVTDLLYEDGVPAPHVPYGKQVSGNIFDISKGPLFKKDCEPYLGDGFHAAEFTFSIEQVTYHHHGHDGFKIKVSTPSLTNVVVHPATMKEMVAVLSKPKKVSAQKVKETLHASSAKNGRSVMFVEHSNNTTTLGALAQMVQCVSKRKRDRDASNFTEETFEISEHSVKKTRRSNLLHENMIGEESSTMSGAGIPIPINAIATSYFCNGKCLCCNCGPLNNSNFFNPKEHDAGCKFVTGILVPFFGMIEPSILSDQVDVPTELPLITESKSFEETFAPSTASIEFIGINDIFKKTQDETLSYHFNPEININSNAGAGAASLVSIDSEDPYVLRFSIQGWSLAVTTKSK
uniref:Uncharacterized protein n=1 Tax=Chaetoceros debilis TaxID=122233 RepID=A0A7S3VAA6_9STRA